MRRRPGPPGCRCAGLRCAALRAGGVTRGGAGALTGMLRSPALLLALLVCLPAPASALNFVFDWQEGDTGVDVGAEAGTPERVRVAYRSDDSHLAFASVFRDVPGGQGADGGWLVLSDGPGGAGQDATWTVFYLDAVGGRLTGYVHDGVDAATSWQHRPFLASWDAAVTRTDLGGGRWSLGFEADVSAVLGAAVGPAWRGTWTGGAFGIAYGPALGAEFTYGSPTLSGFSYDVVGAFRSRDEAFAQAPEPGGLALWAGGLLLAVRRCRRGRRGASGAEA